MKEMNQTEWVEGRILRKLRTENAFSRGHRLEETIVSCLPRHLRGEGKRVLRDLISRGLVIVYGKTLRGFAYQLNSDRIGEIDASINKLTSLADKGEGLNKTEV